MCSALTGLSEVYRKKELGTLGLRQYLVATITQEVIIFNFGGSGVLLQIIGENVTVAS